jgi:hypothetical protein
LTWRGFEQLVAQIYSELAPNATVIHNDMVPGVDSQCDRQIDVTIRFELAGHKLLTVIQAKDYSDSADINDIGEFASVIQDVRANKGITICRSGFTAGARELARNRGIDICNIHDAESRDWSLEISLPIIWIDLLPEAQLRLRARFEGGDSFPEEPTEWILSADGGRTRILPTKTFERLWNAGHLHRDVGPTHTLRDPRLKNLQLEVQSSSGDRAWRPISEFTLTYTVSRRAWLGSFTPDQCRGVLNYEDGAFQVSYLPIGAIPVQRGPEWQELEDPDALAATVPGCIVTTESWQIDPGAQRVGGINLRRVGD